MGSDNDYMVAEIHVGLTVDDNLGCKRNIRHNRDVLPTPLTFPQGITQFLVCGDNCIILIILHKP
jgi:hypothetical protein